MIVYPPSVPAVWGPDRFVQYWLSSTGLKIRKTRHIHNNAYCMHRWVFNEYIEQWCYFVLTVYCSHYSTASSLSITCPFFLNANAVFCVFSSLFMYPSSYGIFYLFVCLSANGRVSKGKLADKSSLCYRCFSVFSSTSQSTRSALAQYFYFFLH